MSNDIPRLELADMPPELAATLQPRVDRLGYLGEFFKCTANQPAALLSFYRLTEDLKEALPDRITELVALTIAGFMGNAYERHQHERLSVKLGFGEAWVAAVEALDPSVLSPEEGVVQRLALVLVERRGHVVSAEVQAVVDAVGAEQAVGVLMLVGRYVAHALIVNSLQLAPPVPSIFAAAPP
jgi:hypothetical protein